MGRWGGAVQVGGVVQGVGAVREGVLSIRIDIITPPPVDRMSDTHF